MANLGMADSLILMVMALVVFGPRRLPQIGRQIGKLMYEFRKASNDFKFQMEEEMRNAEDADRRKKEEERQRALVAPAQQSQTIEATAGTAEASPYPGETVYPPVTATASEGAAEETYPRILPPSTGEQVAASRPSKLAALAEAPTADDTSFIASHETGLAAPDAAPVAVPEEAPAEETTPAAEQATHG
jgi:sec-independent protein translocase protein TatB